MAIYIDVGTVPDVNHISSSVFRYLIRKHKAQIGKFQKNYDYYLGKHNIFKPSEDDEDKVKVCANYAKYVVDISTGYYLGEPVKYNSEKNDDKQKKEVLNAGVQASIKNGAVRQYDWEQSKQIDISRAIEVYENQTISECDAKIAKYIGIFGEAYELEYANSKEHPSQERQ